VAAAALNDTAAVANATKVHLAVICTTFTPVLVEDTGYTHLTLWGLSIFRNEPRNITQTGDPRYVKLKPGIATRLGD